MTFAETVAAAMREFAERGYSDETRLQFWLDQLRRAAETAAGSRARMEAMLTDALRAVFNRLVEHQGVLRQNPGVQRFTLERVAPQLRAELSRRIMASAQLIKLNREKAIETTLQRFAGWVTSVPPGGTDLPGRREATAQVGKALRALPYLERRVVVDQSHKLTATINEVVAAGGGAIAMRWNSHWRQTNYDYRVDHRERDGEVYLLRDSWARAEGLVRVGTAGYYDDVTHVGQEINCRCYATWLYHLRQLPEDMLTAKGSAALVSLRGAVA